MGMSIRKNDQVIVRAGKDRGKKGRVLSVVPDKNRVVVEGVNLIKRHTRPNPQKNIKGGIVEREAAIHASNVMLAWMAASRSTIPPLMFFCGLGRVCRLIRLTPSTITRFVPGTTDRTRPFLPRSLPARTTT